MFDGMIRVLNYYDDLYRMDIKMRNADWMAAKASKGSRPKRRRNRLNVRRATKQRHKRGA